VHAPAFVAERGEGAYLWDADGRRYVDLIMSWGALLFGHAHPRILRAAERALGNGSTFGTSHPGETLLAEAIAERVPGVEMVRFVNSGTEAVMSAVRLARALTGRDRIIVCRGAYHGHADALLAAGGSGLSTLGLATMPSSPGVTAGAVRDTMVVPFNDPAAAAGVFATGPVAAVIVEPIIGNSGFILPLAGYLEGLREACDAHGTLLIVDEVMTGFRVGPRGAIGLLDLRADLVTLGKVVGGGLPLAAYAGPRRLMEQVAPAGPVYQAGTLSGNPVAAAAGLAALELAGESDYGGLDRTVAEFLEHLLEAGRRLGIPLQGGSAGGMMGLYFSERPVRNAVEAAASDSARFAAYWRAMLGRGVLLPPSAYEAWFPGFAHAPADYELVARAHAESLEEIAREVTA
jgi:glutamate-1-semialdehyde 2,1-aminomutase